MKKVFALLLALIVCAAFLVACNQDATNGPEETKAETKAEETAGEDNPDTKPEGHVKDVDISEFYKGVEFELPTDFRQAAVDYMYEQASVKWVCAESFGVKEEWEHWVINLDFQKGVEYTGQPYANSQVNVNLFKRALVDGTYTSPSTSWDDVHGSQCVSSILNALQQVMIIDGWSYTLNPASETFDGKILGNYKVEPKPVNQETPTVEVCKANGADTMYEAYSLTQKGDTIITVNNWVHARMVVESHTEYSAAGKLNPRRSYIKCIEQTNSFDKTRTDGVKTTWFVEHVYTFDKLYEDGYLPATYEVFETGVSHIPYITLDAENKPEILAKGMVVGNVKSNYPLRYVVLEVFDKDGNTVKEYTVRGNMTDYAYGLRKFSYNLFGSGLEKGDYTFVLTAGIALGEHEFERVDFSVS